MDKQRYDDWKSLPENKDRMPEVVGYCDYCEGKIFEHQKYCILHTGEVLHYSSDWEAECFELFCDEKYVREVR